MNTLQKKLLLGVTLIVEARELAKKQGAAYRAEGDIAVGRCYEQLANSLNDNYSITLEGLLRHVEPTNPAYNEHITVTREEVAKSMENMMRYIMARRKP